MSPCASGRGAGALAPGPLRRDRSSATGVRQPRVRRRAAPAGRARRSALPARTAAVEIDLTRLLAARRGDVGAPESPPSRWPRRTSPSSSTTSSPAADVEAALREGAGALLESVRLFDVYTGAQVGEGSKSLAYALRFRAPDRTLTDEETGAARDAAVAEAADRCGAVLRSPTRRSAARRTSVGAAAGQDRPIARVQIGRPADTPTRGAGGLQIRRLG